MKKERLNPLSVKSVMCYNSSCFLSNPCWIWRGNAVKLYIPELRGVTGVFLLQHSA